MKPLDPRLLRYARAARFVLGAGGVLGVLRTIAVLAWCWLVAHILTILVLPVLGGMGGAAGRISEGSMPEDTLPWLLVGAVVALLVRSAASWAMDSVATRGAVVVKTQLRTAALDALDARSPEWLRTRADATTATELGRGLDALDGYFSGYLPQLILTMCATPLLVIAVLLADPLSGIIVLIVFPVIPLFMILIGLATRTVQEQQWAQLDKLSRSFLDVVEGLPTLKIFQREARQIERIERETGDYRKRTMQVLRITFLSGFVLDLAGTFSIALVAVTVGTRLVNGEFPLALGIFVLLLLPEVFIPIRQVGAAFHSSTEGLVAAQQVFSLIEGDAGSDRPKKAAKAAEVSSRRSAAASDQHTAQNTTHDDAPEPHTNHQAALPVISDSGIAVRDLVLHRGVDRIGPVSFSVAAGECVALAGPSGSGKSSVLAALLGIVPIDSGSAARPEALAWVGQRPGLLQGTVAENVALGDTHHDTTLVQRALDTVGLSNIAPDRELGILGAGLSGGQAQRVAIARALYRTWKHDAAALVLDEPSSALDRDTEATIAAALRREAAAGRAVLLVSHRPALLAAADRTVQMGEFA